MLKVLLVVLILIMLPQGSEAQFIGIRVGIPMLQYSSAINNNCVTDGAMTFNGADMTFNGAYMTFNGSGGTDCGPNNAMTFNAEDMLFNGAYMTFSGTP
jgi:hypothetical protein